MSLPSFSVKNPVLVNMMMIVVLIAGGLLGLTLTREMFPESRPDKIGISAVYPGVQAAEIEKSVTIKIEEAVRDVEGIEKIESTIGESISSTVVTLTNEVDDVDTVMQELKNKIDALQNLPDDVEQVSLIKLEPKLPVIAVSIYGEGSEADLKRAADRVRDELLGLPGVSNVEIGGIRDDEISVEVQPDQLMKFNVTFDEVADAIRRTNLDISSGQLKGSRRVTPVRVLGEKLRGGDLENIVVRTDPDGRTIRVSDVAIIRDHFIESDLENYFNDKPAVDCTVYKTGDQDAIEIATLVKAYVAAKTGETFDPFGINAALESPWYAKPFKLVGAFGSKFLVAISGRTDPMEIYNRHLGDPIASRYEVTMHTDLSRFVSGRLDLMTRNGQSGLLLVLVCLYIFLNRRVAFWTAFGLPVSFLGTFIVMWVFGVTMNLLSMFGLIIVLGIIVDDAIVIGENIFRRVEEGEDPEQAAINGAEEVMWPVTIAVTTTIAAFAPLLFVRGQIGDFMEQLPLVVIAALSVSLIEALVILPTHLAHLPSAEELKAASESTGGGPWSRFQRRLTTFQQWFMKDFLAGYYERFLRVALHWRYATLAVSVSLLMMTLGLYAGGIVESVFVQKMDSETLVAALKMPVGTTADNTRAQLKILSRKATAMPEVSNVQLVVARQYDIAGAGAVGNNDASHLGQMIVELQEADAREQAGLRSSQAVLQDLREYGDANLSGVNSVSWEALNGGPGGKAISIQISGRNFEDLIAVGDRIKEELAKFTGVYDLEDSYEEGQSEFRLRLRPTAEPTGVTVSDLGGHVRSALYGREAKRISRNREDVKIMVRYPESFRENPYALESMWIPSGRGLERGWVPLSEVASIEEAEAESTIRRVDRVRSLSIVGEVNDDLANSSDILQKIGVIFREEIAPDYPGTTVEFKGREEEQGKAFASLRIAGPVAMLLIYMLLAGLFKSYFQPIVVMSAIPFGIQGAIIGHWLTGNPFTILSWIGLVALTGILVNDSLVLVDFINNRIRRGLDPFEASIQGATLRLRAILLTTLTTVAGLTPLMFETSFQAKFLIPMAVTLTFGLLFATALTLVIVPTLNMIFFDVLNLLGQRRDD